MLTREDVKGINNKIKGTGTKRYNGEYNTLINSTNGFLYQAEEVKPTIVEEIKQERAIVDMDAIVKEILNKKTVNLETKIEQVEINTDLNVPYFLTPFYMECKIEAERKGITVDEIAFRRLAAQLNISVKRAIKLVQEGLIEVRY